MGRIYYSKTMLEAKVFVTRRLPIELEQLRSLVTVEVWPKHQFELMKRSAILINTARGTIVDPDSLYRALASGQIAAAAVDVYRTRTNSQR